jgi:diguanylate cyclase (GGDEF)-like protein
MSSRPSPPAATDDPNAERPLGERLDAYDRASEYTGPVGTAAAGALFVLVALDRVPGDRLAWWAAALGLAVAAMVVGLVGRWRTTVAVPGHAAAGLVWGVAPLLAFTDGEIDPEFLWLSLAFQFATTAGVLGGATVDVRPARAVMAGLWPAAVVSLLVVGEPLLAAGAVVFAVLVVRDLHLAAGLVRELIHLRAAAAGRARRAARDALRDPLTGLVNRPGLERELAGRDDVVAAMFVDLDRFKEINDRHGHHAGDVVLRAVADRLRRVVRDRDLIARLGGDEFLVVVGDGAADLDRLRERAEQIIAALEPPIDLGDGETALVSASVGLAAVEPGPVDPERVMRESDHAMYAAKRAGRRRVVLFDDALREELDERAHTSAALRRAVRDGELEVWGQPVVDVYAGRVQAVELLVRWHRPDGVMVDPERFIPIAEELGMSFDITEQVVRTAVALQREWAGHPLFGDALVGVNVPVGDLRSGRLVPLLVEALALEQAASQRLLVEITESQELHGDDDARVTLLQLREMGIGVVLDDFGAGFSSLRSLMDLPLDAVKLDRSLVVSLDEDPRAFEMIRSIASLAVTLGRRVVAEGVERVDQVELLRRLGFRSVQGHVFAPPAPLDEMTLWTRLPTSVPLGPTSPEDSAGPPVGQ